MKVVTASRRRASAVGWRLVVLGCIGAGLLVNLGCNDNGQRGGGSTPAPGMSLARGSVFGGSPVVGARVAFVPAADAGSVESLQPVEDIAPTVERAAVTDRNGEFSLQLDPGDYFILVEPSDDDEIHLPGGNFVREAVSLEEGAVSILNIVLSEKPPANAAYVGSSRCLECHPSHLDTTQTLHFLGFRGLDAGATQVSPVQDLEKFPEHSVGLSYYADGNPNDNTGVLNDGFGHRITTNESYNILLGLDGAGLFQAMESLDGSLVSERLYIAFTYGGEGRFKQRYVTRLDKDARYTSDPTQGSYYLLPGQFSETRGDPSRGNEVTVPVWVTYHAERWGAPTVDGGGVGRAPSLTQSFDNSCAGCHFTGMSLTRNADGLFQAHAVPDPGGPLDFDGDGLAEDMNVGCERCHGPGSAHASSGRGQIVQPDYLPPGRANLICGQCHIRGNGNGTIDGAGQGGFASRNDPVTGQIEFVRAGVSPAEFFGGPDGTGVLPAFGTTGGFFSPIDLANDSGASWRDREAGFGSDRDHSKKHRQQYLDHARSAHFRNPSYMVTCWDCHDPHGRERRSQVRLSADNNTLCLRCHAGFDDFFEVTLEMVDALEERNTTDVMISEAVDRHTVEKTFDMVGVAMNLGPSAYSDSALSVGLGRCVGCHMPRTSKTASWITDDEGFVIRGDIASHTFDTISPTTGESMAQSGLDPVPNSCVDCHRGLFRGAFPDYRYRKQE